MDRRRRIFSIRLVVENPFASSIRTTRPPRRFNDLAPDDVIGAPVCPFDQNVGLHLGDDCERRVFVEDDDGIDEPKRQENFDPLLRSIDRSIGAFVRAHRPIRVDTDDQRISELSCLVQVADVSWMQQVEHTVGEHDGSAAALHLAGKRCGLFGDDARGLVVLTGVGGSDDLATTSRATRGRSSSGARARSHLETNQRFHECNAGAFEVHVGRGTSDTLFSTLLRRLGSGDVDVLRLFGNPRQYRYVIRQNFDKAERDGQVVLLLADAVPQFANLE